MLWNEKLHIRGLEKTSGWSLGSSLRCGEVRVVGFGGGAGHAGKSWSRLWATVYDVIHSTYACGTSAVSKGGTGLPRRGRSSVSVAPAGTGCTGHHLSSTFVIVALASRWLCCYLFNRIIEIDLLFKCKYQPESSP